MATLRPLLRTAAASSRARVRRYAGLVPCQERNGMAVGCRGFDGAESARYCVSSFGAVEQQERGISSTTKGKRARCPSMHGCTSCCLLLIVSGCNLVVLLYFSGNAGLVSDSLISRKEGRPINCCSRMYNEQPNPTSTCMHVVSYTSIYHAAAPLRTRIAPLFV